MLNKLGTVPSYSIAIGIIYFQIIASNLWLRYFKFGPLEWAWRTLTYRKRIALR